MASVPNTGSGPEDGCNSRHVSQWQTNKQTNSSSVVGKIGNLQTERTAHTYINISTLILGTLVHYSLRLAFFIQYRKDYFLAGYHDTITKTF